MTSWLAPIVLFSWPIVALGLFVTRRTGTAILWTILAGNLLLPPALSYKVEMIPGFDKGTVSVLAALLGCIFTARHRLRFFRTIGFAEIVIVLFIFSPLVTSLLNTDAIFIGGALLPGVGLYDGLSAALAQFMMVLPFFMGRQYFRTPRETLEILRALVVAGLVYSLPMLFELRMSPILNIWVYGYSPSDLSQAFRDGGYRPVVFLGHGLTTAFFTMTTVLAATALWRIRFMVFRGFVPSGVAVYLGILLLLCKSGATIIYAAIAAPLIRFVTPRVQLRVAILLASFALAYPLLRSADLVPTQTILEAVQPISPERFSSLNTRFGSEDKLLTHAEERFVFGWGRFGRSRTYDAAGQYSSITDGAWVITVGLYGLVGFVALFGLLAMPVFRAASALKFAESPRDAMLFATLALIVAIDIFDLLLNSGLSPWTWLLAGALFGRTEALRSAASQPRKVSSYGSMAAAQKPTF